MEPMLNIDLSQAQEGDQNSRERLIRQYRPFILRTASQICKRQISWNDDEASISLIAFDEAIKRYSPSHGKSFENYAYMVISHRLIDEFRKNSRSHENEQLLMSADDFEHSAIEIATSLEAYHEEQTANDLAAEMLKYDETLQLYGIRLEELEQCSPVHRDTRVNLIRIAKHFVKEPSLMDSLLKMKQLPLRDMVKYAKVSRRTLERHRKYIISLILIYGLPEFEHIRNTIRFDTEG